MQSPIDAPGTDFGAVTRADLADAVHRRVRAFPDASQSYMQTTLQTKSVIVSIRHGHLMNPLIFAGTHIGQISWTNDGD